MKYFRMSYEEVVFKRSYINIQLLNLSIPSFNTDNDTNTEEPRKINKKTDYKNDSDFFMQFM